MLNLKPGVAMWLEVTQDGKGYILRPMIRVGSGRPKLNGKAKRVRSEEQVWVELGRYADDRLARLGLEKTK